MRQAAQFAAQLGRARLVPFGGLGEQPVDLRRQWRATDGGILTIEEDQVRLYRWADLSEVWSIRVDTPWFVAPTVASSANGVAVTIPDDPDPPA